ncbi:MAG: autotransporter outer membrane beta-barrel domain-containing protein, partial [Desulfobulbus sp.]|nr:autotransporter outer membrane beta-barrel domain-containing protein [Desulfobulbus sp.]
EVRTAEALDTMTGSNAVYNTMAAYSTAAEAEGAIRALTDELHAGIRGSLAEESHRLGSLVGSRVAFSSPQMYVPRQEVTAAPQGEAAGTSASSSSERSLRPLSEIARRSDSTVWAEVTGGKTERGGDNHNTRAFTHDTEGVVFGIERRRTGENGWLAGLAFGYEQGDYEVKGAPASGDGKHYRAMAYGTGEAGLFSLRAGAGYGYHTLDTSRHVVFSGYDSRQKADYDAQTVGGFGEVAAIFSPFGKLYVEPFARASYGAVYLSDFEESGGDGALNAQSDAFTEGSSLIGVRGAQALSFHGGQKECHPAGVLKPCGLLKVEAGWRHLIGQDSPKGTYSFRGSESFVAQGADAPRDALEVKVGLDVALTGQATFGVGYEGGFAPDATSNAIRGGLSWRW